MSGFLNVITGGIVSLVETAWYAITLQWDKVVDSLKDALEDIMGLFGIEDEDVISTSVSSQLVITDDTSKDIWKKIALDRLRVSSGTNCGNNEEGILAKLMEYSQVGAGRYSQYYNYGKDKFSDGLPETNLKSIVIDTDELKAAIDTEYGVSATLTDSSIKVPDKYEWVYFYFQENHGYTVYNNEFTYLGFVYNIVQIDYNYGNDTYDVQIVSYEDVTTDVYEVTEVIITPVDETNDNKNTIVSTRTVVTGTSSGVVSDTLVENSNTNELIPKDSESNSYNEVLQSSNTVGNQVYDQQTWSVPSYVPKQYYVVKWYVSTPAEWKYWLYDPETGTYPNIVFNDTYTAELDMLPVATIRNSTNNTNANKDSAYYKETRDLLKIVGIDIDEFTDKLSENPDIGNIEDAFIHFGVSPNSTQEVVSKVMFNMFEYIYNQPDLDSTGKHVVTFNEGPMNLALTWVSQSKVSIAGSIGQIGTYNHSIVGENLVLRKQDTEGYYTELTLVEMSSVSFIDRQGLWGSTALNIYDTNFSIPLTHFFVKQMSPLEQMELFALSLRFTAYSANVTHLEWYETGAFAKFLKIIAIVIIVVVSFFNAPAGQALGQTLTGIIYNLAIAIGISMAIQMVFKATNNPYIRAAAIVVAVVVAGNLANGSGLEGMLDASSLTSAVTNFSSLTTLQQVSLVAGGLATASQIVGVFTQYRMSKLQNSVTEFTRAYEKAMGEVEDASENVGNDVGYYAELSRKSENAYIEGVDLMIYRAIGIQYEYDALYDVSNLKDNFVCNKLKLGII